MITVDDQLTHERTRATVRVAQATKRVATFSHHCHFGSEHEETVSEASCRWEDSSRNIQLDRQSVVVSLLLWRTEDSRRSTGPGRKLELHARHGLKIAFDTTPRSSQDQSEILRLVSSFHRLNLLAGTLRIWKGSGTIQLRLRIQKYDMLRTVTTTSSRTAEAARSLQIMLGSCSKLASQNVSPCWMFEATLRKLGVAGPNRRKQGVLYCCEAKGVGYSAGVRLLIPRDVHLAHEHSTADNHGHSNDR